MKKTTRLHQMLSGDQLDFLMEAHNGLSAKIVEDAGFQGIWGSGLTVSASLGVRDNNEISWTQVLEAVEFMNDAVSIPVLLDGDTGHGNFNNMRRFVKKLEQRGIAGVCIEDKVFPKTNSFLREEKQPLADIDEFCGRIKAGKDVQRDDDFVITARIEAFIAGWGLGEAMKRAEAYRRAGADAILIHSKHSDPAEVFSFLKEWANRLPVLLVPTKYYTTPTAGFRERKVSIVIWANHLLRGAIRKMQEVAARIYVDENLLNVEDQISSLGEVFRLQGDDELQEAEKRYLATANNAHSAIILAASRGLALGKLTEHVPKAMIKLGNETILERMVNALWVNDIHDIIVVAGYLREMIDVPKVKVVENQEYESTGEMVSLAKAIDLVSSNVVIAYGDICFKPYILDLLIREQDDIVLTVDSGWEGRTHLARESDYVYASHRDSGSYLLEDRVVLKRMVSTAPDQTLAFDGEWIGMMKLSKRGLDHVKTCIDRFVSVPAFQQMSLADLLNALVEQDIPVTIQYIRGHWADVDTLGDLNLASRI
ncbi:MAG: phosphoenolpyruvate mutase [Nitrospiraceae bacterium]|nr:phosphoenolpyruvate mutase [Nitrospiraceae bacterium]|tara:strand:+ start:1444 stop:3060 length:1617 start_codon:yes stop_codon:yes gene_type:complete